MLLFNNKSTKDLKSIKVMRKIILLIVFLSVFFTMCTKEESSELNNDQLFARTSYECIQSSYENNNNSYDYIGCYHNELIVEFCDLYFNSYGSNDFKNDGYEVLIDFFVTNSIDTTNFLDFCNYVGDTITSHLAYIDTYGMPAYFTWAYNRNYLTLSQKNYLTSAVNTLDDLTDYIFSESGDLTEAFENMNNDIIDIEDDVVSDLTMSTSEKRLVLSNTAILRYSLYNYLDFLIDSNHPYRLKMTSKEEAALAIDEIDLNGNVDPDDRSSIIIIGGNWKKMGWEDLKGGGLGVVGAAIYNLVPGVGQVSWAATILSFAGVYSADELFSQIESGEIIILWFP
jgi:hypothetical protein